MPFPGRVNEHRKSRSYCRTERPNRRKSLLGSQLSLNTRSKSAVPAQPGAPDGTHPPCGVRTFPPFRQLKCISDGKGKRGRKGWKTVGCPSLAFRSPSKGSFQSSQLHGKYSDSGCGASRKKKTVPDRDGFHERASRAKNQTIFRLIVSRGRSKKSKGVSHSAECDSGLRPKNPQTFEKV